MLGYCFVSLLVASIFKRFNIGLLEISVPTLLIRNVTSLLFLEFSIIYKLNFKIWTSSFLDFSDIYVFAATEQSIEFSLIALGA